MRSELRSDADATSFEAFLDELAAAFVRTPAPAIDGEIEAWLRRLVDFFEADRSSLAEFTPTGRFRVTHCWARPGYEFATGLSEHEIPWLAARLGRGEMFVISSSDEIPAEASAERLRAQQEKLKAHVSIPLMLSGTAIGGLGIACMRQSRSWPPAVLQRLRLVATVFANALSRKRAVQEQLQLSRALEHAGRVAAIGQLASSFAHEIKQPLGASLTNAQTALRLLNSPRPDLAETRAALEDIVDDIRRTGDIVSELRRFLRRQEPSLEVMRVDELVQAVVRFVSPEARSHAVAVRIDVADGVTHVLADRVQIQQVFVNLLLNSFEALSETSPEKRRVLLAASMGPGGRVAFSVIDTGPGIAEHLRASLFEPFVTTKPQGLGIGLAIAQTIITAHGSRLAYSIASEGGAVFTFSLATETPEGHAD